MLPICLVVYAAIGPVWCLPTNGLVQASAIAGHKSRSEIGAQLGTEHTSVVDEGTDFSPDQPLVNGAQKLQPSSLAKGPLPVGAPMLPNEASQGFDTTSHDSSRPDLGPAHDKTEKPETEADDTTQNSGASDALKRLLSWLGLDFDESHESTHALRKRGLGSWISVQYNRFSNWASSVARRMSRNSTKPSKRANAPSHSVNKKGGGGGRGGGGFGGSRGGTKGGSRGGTKGGSKGNSKNQGYGAKKRPDFANERDPPPPYSPRGPPPPYSPGSYGQRGPTRSYWNGQYYPYHHYGYGALLPLGLAAPFFFAGPFGAYGHYCRSGIRENCTVTDFYVNGTWVNETTIQGGVYHHLDWEDATYKIQTFHGGSYVGGQRLESDPSVAVNGTFVAGDSKDSENSTTINPNVTANGTELEESSDNHAYVRGPGSLLLALPIAIGAAMVI